MFLDHLASSIMSDVIGVVKLYFVPDASIYQPRKLYPLRRGADGSSISVLSGTVTIQLSEPFSGLNVTVYVLTAESQDVRDRSPPSTYAKDCDN